MKLKYFAHACFSLTYDSGAVLVTDPYDASVTYPPCDIPCTAALVSHGHFDHNYTDSLAGEFAVIETAGKHSVAGLEITATPSFHDPEEGALRGSNLIMRIEGEGLSIAHLGDLGHMPNAQQLAAIEGLDVLMLPIGGTYTITTQQAEELIAAVKPRVAIAMHFRTDDYEINISRPDDFIRDMQAVRMPREIEITKESIGKLPPVIIMNHKD